MSDGPARFALTIRNGKDKYGPGIEAFVGYESLAEGLADLGEVFSPETVEHIVEMWEKQIELDWRRTCDSNTMDEAVNNTVKGGLVSRASASEGHARAGTSPATDSRELGTDPETGMDIALKNGRYGWYVTDGEINASLAKWDKPAKITTARASKLLQDRRAYLAANG